MHVHSLDLRPSVIGDALLFLELISLERYASGKIKEKRLITHICMCSILIMWFHSTMWIACPLFMLPYLCDGRIAGHMFSALGFRKIRSGTYAHRPVAAAFAACILCGMANPHGIWQFLYIARSISLSGRLSAFIHECRPVVFGDGWSIAVFVLLFLCAVSAVQCGSMKARHLFLLSGTFMMACTAMRCLSYFLPAAFVFLASTEGDTEGGSVRAATTSAGAVYGIITASVIVPVLYLWLGTRPAYMEDMRRMTGESAVMALYESPYGGPGTKVFNSFDTGSLAGYLGMKPYIDSRAEVFDYGINGTSDILSEYIDLGNNPSEGLAYIKETYDPEFYLIPEDRPISEALSSDGAFLVYDDGIYRIYSYEHDTLRPL